MGRVIRHEVVALRCELRSCTARFTLQPLSVFADAQAQRAQLASAVQHGWVIVLTAQLRSYCPFHDGNALMCSCRTNPDRRHLCVRHDAGVAALLWRGGDADVAGAAPASGGAVVRDSSPCSASARSFAA